MRTLLSSLSFLLVANSTIKTSHLSQIKNQMDFAVLPRNLFTSINFQNLWLNQINFVHFSPATFHNCRFGSMVNFESYAPLNIINCHDLSGKVVSENSPMLVSGTKVVSEFESFNIINSKACVFENSVFSTKSKDSVINLALSNVVVKNCNFSDCRNSGIYASNQKSLKITGTTFSNMWTSKEGAALHFQGEKLVIENCFVKNCVAKIAGGGFKISCVGIAKIERVVFFQNKSPKGLSIKANTSVILRNCVFYNNFRDEFALNNTAVINVLDNPPTEPPSLTERPAPTSTQSQSFRPLDPISTLSPPPPPTLYSFNPNPQKNTAYITFVIIICAVVVAIVIIVVIVVIVQKRKNQIYPSDDEEDTDPKKTMVVVKNMYAVKTNNII